MHIEIRRGDDWTQLLLDGELHHEGHSMPDYVYIELLEALGVTVAEPKGDFCDRCGDTWMPEGTTECASCAEYDAGESD